MAVRPWERPASRSEAHGTHLSILVKSMPRSAKQDSALNSVPEPERAAHQSGTRHSRRSGAARTVGQREDDGRLVHLVGAGAGRHRLARERDEAPAQVASARAHAPRARDVLRTCSCPGHPGCCCPAFAARTARPRVSWPPQHSPCNASPGEARVRRSLRASAPGRAARTAAAAAQSASLRRRCRLQPP